MGAQWFGILGILSSNNYFHKGIPGIQTTHLPLGDYCKWFVINQLDDFRNFFSQKNMPPEPETAIHLFIVYIYIYCTELIG